MQKSLDSIMSNSLKAAFGKTKVASENKAEASTGASNPFSNLLERMVQKNQPKSKNTESNAATKISEKTAKHSEHNNDKTTLNAENNQPDLQTNQPESKSTTPEQVIENTQQPQTANEPTSAMDQSLWTNNLNIPTDGEIATAESSEVELATEVTDSTPTSPDITADMTLLLSLQQPMTLGLYQPPTTLPSEASGTEATSSIDADMTGSDVQSATLPGSSLPPFSKLAPLTDATASFTLNVPTGASQTTDSLPDLPKADTLPLSQSSEIPSRGLADILDNGQTALPGTAFGNTEMTMQASSAAGSIEISQTITLSNAQIPLDALSGELEMPTTADTMPISNNAAMLLQEETEFGIATTVETGIMPLSSNQPANNTSSLAEAPPLGATFASSLEQMAPLSQLGDININASENEGPIEFEVLETEIPSTDTGSLPDLSQAISSQTTASSSSTSSAADSPIAQFTSAAQTPAEQVAEGTVYSIKQGQRELIIRLNPDNLGEVRINLQRHGDNSLSARLIASTPESHDLLQSQLDSLKQNLESQGIQVERLSVIMAGSVDTQNQSNQSQQQTGQQQTDANTNNQQQASGQGQPDNHAFAQQMANHSQNKHGANPSHRAAFQQQNNPTTGLPTDGATKPENAPRHHANGNINILV